MGKNGHLQFVWDIGMATYASTNEDILSIVQLRKSCNLFEGDDSFDTELTLYRDSAVDYVMGYLQRPLVRQTKVEDIFLSYGNGDGHVWMERHVPDYIAVTQFQYVSDSSDTMVVPDQALHASDLEVYYESDHNFLKVFFKNGLPSDIRQGSPLLWSIDMGVDYDLSGAGLIKNTIEAYAKGMWVGSNVDLLADHVSVCLRNHRSDYDLSYVTTRDIDREVHDQRIGYGY